MNNLLQETQLSTFELLTAPSCWMEHPARARFPSKRAQESCKGRGQKGWVVISSDRHRGLERLRSVHRPLTSGLYSETVRNTPNIWDTLGAEKDRCKRDSGQMFEEKSRPGREEARG